MPHAISGGSPGRRGAQHQAAGGWGHVQAFRVDDQSAQVWVQARRLHARAFSASRCAPRCAPCPSAVVALTGSTAHEQEMLKILQLPTPSETETESPEMTPRRQRGQDGRCNSESTVRFPQALRTEEARHSGCSDEEDDSSDSDDESFVSSQYAIKARSVKSAQKGGPVTSMSSRASRQNAVSAGAAHGDSPVLAAAYVRAMAQCACNGAHDQTAHQILQNR